jgi:hypothetical protein
MNLRSIARLLATSAALLGLAAATDPAFAGGVNINNLQALDQDQFHLINEDLGAALSYKPMIPSDPLGVTGFDIGVGLTGTELRNADTLQQAVSGSRVYHVLPMPSLRLDKGLPYNLDIGLMVGKVPDSNITQWGGALRWAVIPGDTVLPTVAIRGAATQLNGVSDLHLSTQSIDVSVSKGFLIATPYAGVGEVWIHSTPQGVPTLVSDSFTKTKVFAGVDVNFGLVNVDFEADEVGSVPSFGIKLGFRF